MIKRIYKKFKKIISRPTDRELRVLVWKRAGNERLRYIYDLNANSVVFDLGGYKGQWTSDIFSMYVCKIFIFEPVKKYYEDIKSRFSKNKNILVFQFGLSNENTETHVGLDNDSSSSFNGKSKEVELIKLIKASDFLKEKNIGAIDLIKINIEGGEYDFLEELISSGYIKICKNIQVQFHDFVPQARERMLKIRKELEKTHVSTYMADFVWENWRLKK